jgi:hypothetical protein
MRNLQASHVFRDGASSDLPGIFRSRTEGCEDGGITSNDLYLAVNYPFLDNSPGVKGLNWYITVSR